MSHGATYLIRVPPGGKTGDNVRAKLVILLNLLALVPSVFATDVGFLFGMFSRVRSLLVLWRASILTETIPFQLSRNGIGAPPQYTRNGPSRIAFFVQDLQLASLGAR
jgi:hypothetical protein